jgi:hypothetical protein
MIQTLNFFAPYHSLACHHENQLTRALLVVLRYSPLAHSVWLRMVEPGERLENLPPARFRTQQSQLVKPRARDANAEEATIRGLSVWLAPDPGRQHAAVTATERRQILDGIVEYGDKLVVAIENKIRAGAASGQPTSINIGEAAVDFDPRVRTVAWQELLEAFADVSLRGLVMGPEQKLLDDFLEFAEHHFPQIGPYSTLRRAAASRARVARRLDAVLAAATGVEERARQDAVSRALPPHPDDVQRSVGLVFLDQHRDSGDVRLRVYPGDTLSQAKVLYARPDAVRGLLAMDGWKVRPNHHWGFMTSGYCWSHGSISAANYIEHWIGHIRKTGGVPRSDWDAEWTQLEALGIVAPSDRPEFERRFVHTRIGKAYPRPGLRCEYAWPLETAIALDDAGRFVETVRDAIAGLLTQLGELCPLPHPER